MNPENLIVSKTDKGGHYVHEADSEVSDSKLRRIVIGRVHGHGLNEDKFNKAMDIVSRSNLNYPHLILNPLYLYLDLFQAPFEQNKQSPLWLNLVKTGKGLRNFSSEMLDHVRIMFDAFGIPSPHELAQKGLNSGQHYRLALYKQLVRTDSPPKLRIKSRIQLNLIPDESELNSILNFENISSPMSELDRWACILLFWVTKVKLEKSFPKKTLFEKYDKMQWEINSDSDKKSLVSIINSINFLRHRIHEYQDLDAIYKSFDQIQNLISEISDDTRNHVQGNLYFQKAILCRYQKDTKNELWNLLRAKQYDPGFFDYDYRIALILTDLGDSGAKAFYENALKTSPLPLGVVNDYGFFLNKFDFKSELSKWEYLFSKLNIFREHH